MYRFFPLRSPSIIIFPLSSFLSLSLAMLVQLISRDICNCMQIFAFFMFFFVSFYVWVRFFFSLSAVDAIEWVFVSFGCLNDVPHKKRTRIRKNFNEIFPSGIFVCLVSMFCIINIHCHINISKIVYVAWEIITTPFHWLFML